MLAVSRKPTFQRNPPDRHFNTAQAAMSARSPNGGDPGAVVSMLSGVQQNSAYQQTEFEKQQALDKQAQDLQDHIDKLMKDIEDSKHGASGDAKRQQLIHDILEKLQKSGIRENLSKLANIAEGIASILEALSLAAGLKNQIENLLVKAASTLNKGGTPIGLPRAVIDVLTDGVTKLNKDPITSHGPQFYRPGNANTAMDVFLSLEAVNLRVTTDSKTGAQAILGDLPGGLTVTLRLSSQDPITIDLRSFGQIRFGG